MRELVIDSFAGGGGASEGIRMALGRDPDIAVNHDPLALAMHRVNHPGTRHMVQDVATVDSVGMCAGRPIGMLWMSPDCTDHSKAKGAAPRREAGRTTRGIGWAIVGWVKALPKPQRPRLVFLENVEEYVDWGPLAEDGKRCPARKGETFKAFVAAWRALGYTNIEWRQRRAWWSGSGTIRKRLYMIMRRDGEPITWPEREFGNPNDAADAAAIASGALQPWVTVAECLDFGLPCPSIFDSVAEIRARHGIRAKRPLAEKTLARVAKGVRRYVLDAPKPFLVKVNHTGRNEARDRRADAPASAMTGKRDDALIVPVVAGCGGRAGQLPPKSAGEPKNTVTAKPDEILVTPFVTKFRQNSIGHALGEPTHTITAHASESHGGGAAPLGLVAVHVQRQFGNSVGSEAEAPNGTDTAGGGGKSALLGVFLAQHNDGPRPGAPGHEAGEPISTITTVGSQQGFVAASMLSLRGSDRRDAPADEPARTSSAQGQHDALVSLPLMTAYYGSETGGEPVDRPGRTETTRDRFGLVEALAGIPPFSAEHEARAQGCWDGGAFVTIDIDGVTLVLVDIGMRMLTPRERFNANGFPPGYIIDHGLDEDGRRIVFTLEQQGYMCGNAVCPTEARALVAANYRPREVEEVDDGEAMPLFEPGWLEAAE